jgi:Flp pilus assembly protein TadG
MTLRLLHVRRVFSTYRRNESGQALVELAFTLTLLSIILLGSFEFGRLIFAAIEVSNAAKAAVQYAAMNGGAYMDSSGITNVANADGYDLQLLLGNSTPITATPSYACSCTGADTCTNNTAPNPPTGCAASHLIVTVTVTTSATFTPIGLRIPGFPNTIGLQGNAVAQVIP